MAAFIGATPTELVQQLGVPDKEITVGGVQYIAYVRRDEQLSPGVGFGGFYGGPFWGSGFGGPFVLSCRVCSSSSAFNSAPSSTA